MITGFLKNNRMKLSTGRGDNAGRISARQAWIPLKKGKAELMMHEIAVDCVNVTKPVRLGLPKFDHGKNQCPWFREGTCSCTRIRTNRIVGAGTSTSFGAGSCAFRVRSHKGGTDKRLLGMTGKTVSTRTMCSKQVRVSSKIRRRGQTVRVPAVAAATHVGPKYGRDPRKSRLDLVRVQVRDGESLPISSCTDDGD